MNNKGSISVEASIGMFAFLFVTVLIMANIYAYIVMGISFEKATVYYLENNYSYVSDKDINNYLHSKYIKKEGDKFIAFKIEEEFVFDSDFLDSSDHMVYVTITGEKYHKLTCQHARLSSKMMNLNDAKTQYEPCSKCIK